MIEFETSTSDIEPERNRSNATARTKKGLFVGEVRPPVGEVLVVRDQNKTRTQGDMWTICDSRLDESVTGLTILELPNLLAGMHGYIKRHGYTVSRLLTTLRYLEDALGTS